MKVVILAGGVGERLKPLTNAIPKALASIHGKPIIQQQIEILATLGMNDFTILTGYRSEMISSYLALMNKNSSATIKILETPIEFTPSQRLSAAKDVIGDDFLLIYCDNLVDDYLALKRVISSTEQITFLAERRSNGNLTIDPRTHYFAGRSTDSPYVELGYIHVNTPDFFQILNSVISLQHALETLTRELNCATEIIENSLLSVSNISRFNALRSQRKTILLDRDGILNKKLAHRKYLGSFDEYFPLVDNLEILSRIYSEKTDFIIITNQPGISTGEVTEDFLDKLHSRMITDMLSLGISVIGLYVCKHHWDENCICRKPKPGMILQAIKDYGLVPEKIVYIGDEMKDLEAAKNAGISGVRLTDTPSDGEFKDLNAAFTSVQRIISR